MTQPVGQFLRLLGPPHVTLNQKRSPKTAKNEGESVPRFRSQRTVALLGYLVAENRPVARAFLAALFWPDEPPAKGRGNLRRELHNLSQVLPGCWEFNRQSAVFVSVADSSVDLYQLRQLAEEERWEDAAELLGGDFLEGVDLDHNPEFENWLLGERERWRGRSETILRQLIAGATQRGRYVAGLRHARRLLQISPWDEETHRQIMRFLAWTGQRGAALRQFESCKQMLREALAVDPAVETIALYKQIQAGELSLPPQLPAFLTTEKPRHAYERPFFVGREHELTRLNQFLDEALAGHGRTIFITGGPGRGKTALTEAFVQQAMENHPQLLVAGGKCNAYSGVGDPYLPFREALAMLTGDVEGRWEAGAITGDHARRLWAAFPSVMQTLLDHGSHLMDILIPGAGLLSRAIMVDQADAPWLPRLRERALRRETSAADMEQSYLFQQMADLLQRLTRERPLLLIMDDIQWADAASVSLLFHLGRFLADADCRLLIVCAYRPEEVNLGYASTHPEQGELHPLAKVLTEFKRTFGNVWVDLDHMEAEKERRFMDALVDIEQNQLGKLFRAALFKRTGGHPLFTLELLRAMQAKGNLLKNAAGAWVEGPSLDWDLLPARVEAAVEERIDRLDPTLQEMLTVASVEGEQFTAEVVAEALKLSERSILRRLSQELERQHRLVKEQEEVETASRRMSYYRFSHALFQDYLYKRLGQGERRMLHGAVAAALERLHEGQLDGTAVKLAHHFYRAGHHDRAYHYSSLAAERAARIYDNREAVRHYTRAIRLAEWVNPDAVSLVRLHRRRGLAFARLGEFEQAGNDHTTILTIAQAAGERQTAWQALIDLGELWESRDYNQTRIYFQEALDLSRQMNDPALLASSLNWMGNWCANAEKPQAAVSYHQDALEIVDGSGDQWGLANTLDFLGIAHFTGGNPPASARYYDRAIALFRELDDRPRLVSSLTGRAATVSMLTLLASVPAPLSSDMRSDTEEALQIARAIGLASGEAWAYWALGMLCIVTGCYGQALKALQNGLRIAYGIAHREYIVGNLFALGILYAELFAPDLAQDKLEEASKLAEELNSPTLTRIVGGTLADVYLMQNDFRSAQACLETVISPQTKMDSLGKRYCWARQAELSLLQGNPALSLDITERLIASAPGMKSDSVITFLWKLKAEALSAIGRKEEACVLLQAAIENAQAAGEQFLLWRLHAGRGRICRDRGRQVEAEKEFLTARTLIDALAASIFDAGLQENYRLGASQLIALQ